MRIALPSEINRIQWLRRLGVTGEPDADLMAQLDAAQEKLMGAAAPQGTCRIMEAGELSFPGESIKKHLADCNGIVVMAVTLGAGIDRLIRISQVRDMAEAVILDSGASILAEQCADLLEEMIRTDFAGCKPAPGQSEKTTYFTGRFSPGYGDLPVEAQKGLIKALDGPRAIGLSVNESCILTPRKSITAIMGTADHPVKGHLATCDECLIKESCGLRKEGKQCWT